MATGLFLFSFKIPMKFRDMSTSAFPPPPPFLNTVPGDCDPYITQRGPLLSRNSPLVALPRGGSDPPPLLVTSGGDGAGPDGGLGIRVLRHTLERAA